MGAREDAQPQKTENPLTRAVKWLLYSNLSTGIAVAAMTSATMILLRVPFNPFLPFISFAGCMLIYSLNRQTDLKEDSISLPERSGFTRRHGRFLLNASVLLFVLSLLVSLWIGIWILAIALLPQLTGMIYSVFRLKRVFLLKNLAVTFAFSCSLLIVVVAERPDPPAWILLWGVVFLTAFIDTVIFDIKDMEGDAAHGIRTIPGELGIHRTKIICNGLLCCAAVLTVPLLLQDPVFLALIPFFVFIGAFIYRAPGRDPPWWYYGIFVEGEFLVLLAFALLLR